MTTTTLFINELPCTCETCMAYLRVTDGDYEHSFVVAHTSGLKQCIKPTTSNHRSPRHLGGRLRGQLGDIYRSKYVNFTPKQKSYLRIVFDEHPSVGRNDLYKDRINTIREQLIDMGYPHQIITHTKIMAWFKNERYRRRHRIR